MSPFTVLIFIAFAAGAFGFIDEETELNFTDEPLSSEDPYEQNGEWDERIVGGSTARPGQFPHQAFIRGPQCGASILTRSFVMTAAGCTQSINSVPSMLRVVVGARRQNLEDGIEHRVRSVHNHYNYFGLIRRSDISIVRTVTYILFDTPLVRPVTLPQTNVPDAGNLRVIVSGYGHFRYPGSPGNNFPEFLQYQEALTLNRLECMNRHGSRGKFIHDTTVCVHNEPGRGACAGDQGSPLITTRGVQVGIFSWTYYCGRVIPDVYTNVFSHIEWIRRTIRDELKKKLSD